MAQMTSKWLALVLLGSVSIWACGSDSEQPSIEESSGEEADGIAKAMPVDSSAATAATEQPSVSSEPSCV